MPINPPITVLLDGVSPPNYDACYERIVSEPVTPRMRHSLVTLRAEIIQEAQAKGGELPTSFAELIITINWALGEVDKVMET